MNLTKRLSLSFVAIVLVLIALLVAAHSLAPTPRPELPSTDEDLPPNLLSGAVTGLDPGDNVRLHLEQLAEGGADGRGEIVKGFDVANGRWQQPGLALTPGYYRLIPEAKGYVQIPQSIVLQVPEESIVWRYTSLSFDFLHPEDAPARLGLPLCPEPAPHVAVTAVSEGTPSPTPQSDLVQSGPPGPPSDLCYANHLAAVRLVPAGLQGHISGLPDGQMATIALYALPPVPGESYGQGEPPPMDSSWVYPPEVASLTEPPEIAPDWPLTVTLVVGNGHWGLIDPSLVGGKYLVVAYAHGQTVVPRAYEVVIFAGKAPGFPGGVEFAFDPEPQGAPSNETPAAPETPPAPPPPKPMLTPMTEPTPAPTSPSAPTLADLVLQPDGLGMADFGDDSDAVIASLSGIPGAPDFDSGWQDPSLPASEPLWPGCPGTSARLSNWDEPGPSIVLTDWAQNDLQSPGDARASTGSPYFAGYSAGAAEPPQLGTPEGAYPGMTLPELQGLYGDRLFISPEPDGAVRLYWFSVDRTGSPLTRTGGIRGWLFEPDITSPDYQPGLRPGEASETRGFIVGLSCSTP